MGSYPTGRLRRTGRATTNLALCRAWAATNYALGLNCFSYAVARRKLAARLADLFGEGL
jgi:hypothetical protein